MRLFCIPATTAAGLPYTETKRVRGGSYYLYSAAAVDIVLADRGMARRRSRMRFVAKHPQVQPRYACTPFLQEQSQEDARHARMQAERKVDPVKKAQKEQEVTDG